MLRVTAGGGQDGQGGDAGAWFDRIVAPLIRKREAQFYDAMTGAFRTELQRQVGGRDGARGTHCAPAEADSRLFWHADD